VHEQTGRPTTTVRLVTFGTAALTLDAATYGQARDAGLLADLVTTDPAATGARTVVIEADGTLIDPGSDDPPRASLLHSDGVTAALAGIIGLARDPRAGCPDCCEIAGACPLHLAEAIVARVRQETLIIQEADAADAVLAHAVTLALNQAADAIEQRGRGRSAAWAASIVRQHASAPNPPVHDHTYGMSCPVTWCFWPADEPSDNWPGSAARP
jgi:hypothetical protein